MPRVHEEVTQNVGLTAYLHSLVCEHPDFEVLCLPIDEFYCFRYIPNGLAEHKDQLEVRQLLDRLNAEIVDGAQSEGPALVTKMYIDTHVAICIWLSSDNTVREDVDATFEVVARWGRLCSKKHLSSVVN